ncbi:hypothetical protein TNCV_2292521 [Trichonephila clavipes]|nr:hypothetical protein TNCV_2292521 [Trichonephila clavipes]
MKRCQPEAIEVASSVGELRYSETKTHRLSTRVEEIASSKTHLLLCSIQRLPRAGSGVVQSGRPIFDDFFQPLWPHIGNNTANVVFQMVKRLWLIRTDQ